MSWPRWFNQLVEVAQVPFPVAPVRELWEVFNTCSRHGAQLSFVAFGILEVLRHSYSSPFILPLLHFEAPFSGGRKVSLNLSPHFLRELLPLVPGPLHL